MKSIEDNMSLSEIVRNRFKKNIQINLLSTQEQVEKYIIADPTTANLE
jgi:DNA-binding protein